MCHCMTADKKGNRVGWGIVFRDKVGNIINMPLLNRVLVSKQTVTTYQRFEVCSFTLFLWLFLFRETILSNDKFLYVCVPLPNTISTF